jgi:hypothetical protein
MHELRVRSLVAHAMPTMPCHGPLVAVSGDESCLILPRQSTTAPYNTAVDGFDWLRLLRLREALEKRVKARVKDPAETQLENASPLPARRAV